MIPDPRGKKIARALLIKLDADSHERRVRFIVRNSDKSCYKEIKKGICVNHKPRFRSIIERIVINPRAEHSYLKCVKSVVGKYSLDPSIIGKSELYTQKKLAYKIISF